MATEENEAVDDGVRFADHSASKLTYHNRNSDTLLQVPHQDCSEDQIPTVSAVQSYRLNPSNNPNQA